MRHYFLRIELSISVSYEALPVALATGIVSKRCRYPDKKRKKCFCFPSAH